MDLDKCSEIINHKNISVKENKSKITFCNKNSIEVNKVQVDGCLDIPGVKCDWLIIIDKPKDYPDVYIEIYIELKGGDVKHAFKQIENTINNISIDQKNVPKYCYVITTRYPRITSEIQNQKKDLKKNYNAVLKVQTTVYTENINKLISGCVIPE
ncbi:MAG: hypothetical protein QNJ51_12520 [Calothrix sp. MO_167.B12]|nr:hypothetical protein [Calothrix sp. MO_167.B12]